MRHVYTCPLRWADLDLLGHVNNVVYVDYLQEARIDMLARHDAGGHAPDAGTADLAEGVVVVRNDVLYVRPLTLRRDVRVDVWVTEVRAATFTLAYEVWVPAEEPAGADGGAGGEGGRTVFLRATSVLAPYDVAQERPRRLTATERTALARYAGPPPEGLSGESATTGVPTTPAPLAPTGDRHRYDVTVRFSDVDVFRHVNNVTYFEYLQEARVVYFGTVFAGVPERSATAVVVARKEVVYLRPVLFRPEPYQAYSWVSRVGRTSYVVDTELRDGDVVHARGRAVLVAFDAATQRAAVPHEAVRARLLEELAVGPAQA